MIRYALSNCFKEQAIPYSIEAGVSRGYSEEIVPSMIPRRNKGSSAPLPKKPFFLLLSVYMLFAALKRTEIEPDF